MATGWPTKVTYANGDVFNASDINDTNGTLNYIDPTSATNNQVVTRDSAAPGKVKWANSPANTLTTTGDLYYASAANTPARLGIGSTNQVLTVTGGLPVWGAAGGGMTVIASGTLSGALSLTSITGIYKDLKLVYIGPIIGSTSNVLVRLNSVATNYSWVYYAGIAAPVLTYSSAQTSIGAGTGGIAATGVAYYFELNLPQYANTTKTRQRFYGTGNEAAGGVTSFVGELATTGAITTISDSRAYTGGSYILYGVS